MEPAAQGFDGEARRLHPMTLLLAVFRLGPQSVNMLPGLIALGFLGRWWLVVPGLALFLLISLGWSWLAWARFTWRVDADDIAISSGIFSRNHRTIPFDRIQDVNIEQGLMARALGLAKVSFETGSAAGDKEDEGKLDAIALADAQALRDHIRSHRAAIVAPVVRDDNGDAPAPGRFAEAAGPLFAMTPRRILIAGLFNFSLAVFALLFGLLQTFDNFLPIKPFSSDFWLDLLSGLGLEEWLIAHRWLSVAAGVLTVLVLGIGTGIVRTAMQDWNFRLERSERGFRRTRGLTTRTDVVIPAARVQAAIVEGGLVRRRFGWFALKLQSLASDGSGKSAEQDHMVAPLATLAETDAILAEIGLDRAELEEHRGEWNGTHPMPVFVAPVMVLVIGTIALTANLLASDRFAGEDWYAISLPIIIGVPLASALLLLALGWFQWSHSRWRFDGRVLHIAHGFRKRTHIILPARNIQSADLTIGPLTRRFGLAVLKLGVPGGSAGQHHIAAFPEADARALRAALLSAR